MNELKKLFVYQDWPSIAEVRWSDQFASALREHGYDVFQEWTQPKPPPTEAAAETLRASDAIVFLLFRSTSLESTAFYFNLGIAEFGEKAAVGVVGKTVTTERIPTSNLRSHVVPKTTPQSTANRIVAQLRQLEAHRAA
jgi:hypothetical protein